MSSEDSFLYPQTFRRLRQNSHVRDLTREVWLSQKQFIQPLFVVEGLSQKETIKGLDGTFRDAESTVLQQIESDLKHGVQKFLLFAVPQNKQTKNFDYSFATRQIQSIKQRFGDDIWLAADVCLCSSTSHGHCGVLNAEGDHLDNHASVIELARQAIEFANAGADCVAPSDMMDGRIAAIKEGLLRQNNDQTLIMSYAAKFKSNFYGPFRAAADSAPQTEKLKDRASYQIESSRFNDAFQSSARDDAEGADILMVKPALPYLDVLKQLSQDILKPWAVYQVSGEYAAINLLAKEGLADQKSSHVELWTAYKRAGADIIISYGARYAKDWISEVQG